jgi:site-specific DNA-methyltransferase (adenine-specific)
MESAMSERVVIGDATLYLGDCLEVLPTLATGSVDAIITDPPFGIGFKYESHDDTPNGYAEWMWHCIEIAESKCAPGSPIFVWQAMPNIRHLATWFPRDWRIFAACKNFVQMRPTAMQYAFDPVLVWWTDGKKWAAGTANRDYYIGNTANTLRRGDGDAFGHPCARPLDQVRHIIEQWVRPSGTVLDCFAGSGTTGVACAQTGRRFIGIEIDPVYFEIAVKRIAAAYAQPRLPLAEPDAPAHIAPRMF